MNQIPEINYLRAFAILAVLAIHVSGCFTLIPQINFLMIVNVVIDVFTHYAVSLFFLISGFVLYLKYNRNYSVKEFWGKRFLRVIPPYLIFTVFYLFIWIILKGIVTGVYAWPSFMKILSAFFTQESSPHLWFVLILIELYLLYPVFVKMYHFFADRYLGWLFILITLILQLSWRVFGANLQLHIAGNDVSITDKVFFYSFFYFALGFYMCDHYDEIKNMLLSKSILVYAVPVIIFTGIRSFIWLYEIQMYGGFHSIPKVSFLMYDIMLQPFCYLFTFALLFVLCNWLVTQKRDSKWLLLIGAYSFGIYLIHPFFQGGITYVLNLFGINYLTAIYYPFLFVSVLACSIVFVCIMRKVPYHKYIIG
jgi:peptidoglycan/LPS O-acetylase OafA/YrhL